MMLEAMMDLYWSLPGALILVMYGGWALLTMLLAVMCLREI